MLKEVFDIKGREKPRIFQVLLLRNDASQEVEVQEAGEIDFLRVQEHLKRGGSIFITSKNSQKLSVMPKGKQKIHQNMNEMKTLTAYYFDHV